MNTLLEKNYKWWNTNDDNYCVDNIKKENPKYNMDLLIEINNKIITTESQQQLHDELTSDHDINTNFISRICELWNYNISELQNRKIIYTYQRPYLELLTTNDIANKIFNSFKDDQQLGITNYNNKKFRSNDTMISLVNSDNIRFQTKNLVILTYYELDENVSNKDNIITKFLTPTTFKHDHKFLCKDFSHIDSEDGFENIDLDNLSKIFIIGKTPIIDINSIFDKLLKSINE